MANLAPMSFIPTATVTQAIPTSAPIQLTGLPLPSMNCPKPIRTCKRDRDLLRKRSEQIQFLPDGTVNVSPITDMTYKEIKKCCKTSKIWTYPELCTAWCEAGDQPLAELNACFWLPSRRGLKPGLTTVTCNGSSEDCGNINAPGNTTTMWIANIAAEATASLLSVAEPSITSTTTSAALSTPSSGAPSFLRTGDSKGKARIAAQLMLLVSLVNGFLL